MSIVKKEFGKKKTITLDYQRFIHVLSICFFFFLVEFGWNRRNMELAT
jgi:hypothetical protein